MRVESIANLFIIDEKLIDKDNARIRKLEDSLKNKNDSLFTVEIDKDKLIGSIEKMDDKIILNNDSRADEEDIILQFLSKALFDQGFSISDVVNFKRLDVENLLYCLTKDKEMQNKIIETLTLMEEDSID